MVLDCLAAGQTLTAAAAEVEVSGQTLWNWRKADPSFAAEIERLRNLPDPAPYAAYVLSVIAPDGEMGSHVGVTGCPLGHTLTDTRRDARRRPGTRSVGRWLAERGLGADDVRWRIAAASRHEDRRAAEAAAAAMLADPEAGWININRRGKTLAAQPSG